MSEQPVDKKEKGAKASWRNLHECSRENDIRYRGPLSYGGLQILGWLCIVLTVVKVMMELGSNVSEDLAPKFDTTLRLIQRFSGCLFRPGRVETS